MNNKIYSYFTWKNATILFASTTFILSIILALSISKSNDDAVEDYKVEVSKGQIEIFKDSIEVLRKDKEQLKKEKKDAILLRDQNFNNYLKLENTISNKDKEINLLKQKKIKTNQIHKEKDEKITNYPNDSLSKYIHEYILTSYRNRHYK